jgi:hypothetical protein
MKGKTLLSLAIVLAMVLAAMPFAAVKAVPPCTVKVIFENGTSYIEKIPCSQFNVSINIYDSPNIDFFDMGIQWDPAVLELKTGTAADVYEGGFMKAFGATSFPGPSSIDNIAGNMPDIPCGFTGIGVMAHGNGTLFKVAFHCKAPGDGNIKIMNPNVISVLLLGVAMVNIDVTVNGTVHQPFPPVTNPQAIITLPVDSTVYTVGNTVTLDGSHSTDGIDTVPFPAGEACPINVWDWTINNGTVYHLFGAHQSFVCSGAGSVTILLTVTAPDPTPNDDPSYHNQSTSSPVTVYQVTAAAGPAIDVYTDRGGQGHLGDYPYSYAWSDAYGPQEEVCVYAKVTYNGAPVEYKPVDFFVYDPYGTWRESRVAFTNASGIAKVCFRIPWEGSSAEWFFGNWSIYGTVSISEVQVSDTVKFPFGYLLSIKSISALPFTVHRGIDTMYINVTISSIAIWASYVAFLQITAVDNCNVPIGMATDYPITVPPGGLVSLGNTITIPSWAYAGAGTVYADLLMGGVWSGTPYCPEKTAGFLVVWP